MRKNGGFIELALIFVIILGALLAFTLFRNINKTPTNPPSYAESQITNTIHDPTVSNNRKIIPTKTTSDEWNIPDLPSGFNWQTRRLDEDEARDYQMYSSIEAVRFPTTVNYVDLNYEESNDILDYWEVLQEYSREMDDNGWNFDVHHEDKRITGTAADGVFGSIYGNVKVKGDQIRSVGYSYNLKPASWDGPGSEIVCPCQLHLEIFVGDEVSLKDV